MDRTSKEAFEYWVLSDAKEAQFSRCRGEFPFETICDVSDEDIDWICSSIRERLENGNYYRIYVSILAFFHDRNAIAVLTKSIHDFKEKCRFTDHARKSFTAEIRYLKHAIRYIKRGNKHDSEDAMQHWKETVEYLNRRF